ncbi:MAG: hypothetical protein JW727_05735 [Candidatus Aenigmarchaeota archaeon]|nr:hypothetical protein [Candidatus Aenigmarchaeota archaeon]
MTESDLALESLDGRDFIPYEDLVSKYLSLREKECGTSYKLDLPEESYSVMPIARNVDRKEASILETLSALGAARYDLGFDTASHHLADSANRLGLKIP